MANLLNLVKMTLSELRELALSELRELARKYLGQGHKRLKTKSELIAALKEKLGDSLAKSVPAKAKSPAKAKAARKKRAATRPSGRARTRRAARVSSRLPPAADIAALRAPPKAEAPPKVLSEGFFAGAQPSTLGSPRARVHSAPALPEGYGSNEVVAINRGPGTLFVFWDFGEQTILSAVQDLVDWRLVLRVFRGAAVVREFPVDLAHGRAHLEDLPTDSDRVELSAVGTNASRRIAGSNIPASFQGAGPSPLRLADLAWDMPLSALPEAASSGAVHIREQTDESAQWVRARVAGAAGSSSPLAPWGAGRRRFGLPSSR